MVSPAGEESRRAGEAPARGAARAARPVLPGPEAGPPRVVVLYDGWCGLCRAAVRRLASLDRRGRLSLVSFRSPGVLARYGIDPGRAERRMVAWVPPGRVLEGIDAVRAVAAAVPALWPLRPVLWLAAAVGLGQPLYDAVAKRRFVLGSPACGGSRCTPDG